MASRFQTNDPMSPIQRAVAVTPSDSTVLAVTDGIHIGGAGNVTFTMADGSDCTFTALPVGWYRLAVTKVKSSGLTASNIVALYINY